MQLPDVNVLVYAYSRDSPHHEASARWLENLVNSRTAFGISELVCSSVIRILTNRRMYAAPATIDDALAYVAGLLARKRCVRIRPGDRHFEIFSDLCRGVSVRGNDVTDAYLAALAIESGCEWVTYDRGFARFPGLRWRTPLEAR